VFFISRRIPTKTELEPVDAMQLSDSQTSGQAGKTVLAVFLLLLSSHAILAGEVASDSGEFPSDPSRDDLIGQSALRPLWGGPTSFDTGPADIDHVPTSLSSTSLHHFDLACERCHDGGVFEDGAEFAIDSLGSDVDINMSCTLSGCHDYNPIVNHPVDISPTGFVPEAMRLDSFGRITCLTCHDPETSTSETPSKDRPLVVPDGMDFCASCHFTMSGTSKEQAHWQFSTKAHLESIGPNRFSANTELPSGLLDSESQSCLSCHEGINATVSEGIGTSGHSGRSDMTANHPIGMSYSGVASAKALRYNRLSSVNLDIRLFDGKMGCGSCHSLYSGLQKNLVQDNTGSRLCFECHNM
jgi:predicted CXXCH cytochrome family protein